VVLQPDEEAWWCESLTEARAWGMNPADYADLMREAFETGQHNAPVSNLEDAATQLASVSCDVEYARAAATLLGWGN
jgi:hypothetical protein